MKDSKPGEKSRLLAERPLPRDGQERAARRGVRPARTVTVNLVESPLGWLKARGLVSERQFAAGEALRGDWERASLEPAGDDALGCAAARSHRPKRAGSGSADAAADRRQAPLRSRGESGGRGARRHPLAGGLCGRRNARCRTRSGLARARRQGRARHRAQPARRPLPATLMPGALCGDLSASFRSGPELVRAVRLGRLRTGKGAAMASISTGEERSSASLRRLARWRVPRHGGSRRWTSSAASPCSASC